MTEKMETAITSAQDRRLLFSRILSKAIICRDLSDPNRWPYIMEVDGMPDILTDYHQAAKDVIKYIDTTDYDDGKTIILDESCIYDSKLVFVRWRCSSRHFLGVLLHHANDLKQLTRFKVAFPNAGAYHRFNAAVGQAFNCWDRMNTYLKQSGWLVNSYDLSHDPTIDCVYPLVDAIKSQRVNSLVLTLQAGVAIIDEAILRGLVSFAVPPQWGIPPHESSMGIQFHW